MEEKRKKRMKETKTQILIDLEGKNEQLF